MYTQSLKALLHADFSDMKFTDCTLKHIDRAKQGRTTLLIKALRKS